MRIILTEKAHEKTQDEQIVAENTDQWLGKQMVDSWNAFNPNSSFKMKLVSEDYVPSKVEIQPETNFEITGQQGTNLNQRLLNEIVKLKNIVYQRERTYAETTLLKKLQLIRNTELGLFFSEGTKQEFYFEKTQRNEPLKTNTDFVGKLRQLLNDNPEVNILPVINGKLIEDTFSINLGDIANCYLDKVYYFKGVIYLHSKNLDELVQKEVQHLEEKLQSTNSDYSKLVQDVKRVAKEEIDSLDWEEVIIIEVNL